MTEVFVHLSDLEWLGYLGPTKRQRARALQCLYSWDAFFDHFHPHSATYIHHAVLQRDRHRETVRVLSRRNMRTDDEHKEARVNRLKLWVEGKVPTPKAPRRAVKMQPAVPQPDVPDFIAASLEDNKRPGDPTLEHAIKATKRHKTQ